MTQKYIITNISNLRDSADILFDLGKYEAAYGLYEEAYNRVWFSIGQVQEGISSFTKNFLESNLKTTWDFQRNLTQDSAKIAFQNNFGLDIDETWNEFIFSVYGKLQCIAFSHKLFYESSLIKIYTDYLLLFTLILQDSSNDWINHTLKIFKPILEDEKLKSISPRLSEKYVKIRLADEAKKIKKTDWFALNISLLESISKTDIRDNEFHKTISEIIGIYTSFLT